MLGPIQEKRFSAPSALGPPPVARLLLSDGEDLHTRWRPHFASYIPRYLVDLLWATYGLAGFVLQRWTERATNDAETWTWLAPAFFLVCAALHAFFSYRQEVWTGVAWAIGWASAAAAIIVLALMERLPISPSPMTVLLGAAATVLLLARTELSRLRRHHFLTNRRLIVRHGIASLTERTLEIDRVQSVRGVQGPLGQVANYGTLHLSLVVPARRKPGDPQPSETLDGVPRWDEVKHRIELLLEERRLPPKERQKRIEERRLRDSMRALADWAHPQNPR